jgi:hypothetical protein
MATVSATITNRDEGFEPGQLGIRHLLGAMTVAAIVLGLSAARLRSLSRADALQVGLHWLIVLGVAGGMFVGQSLARRRNRLAAGELLLRVLTRPMTEERRRIIRWLLTVGVVADGLYISLLAHDAASFAVYECMLWSSCLHHWLANVYWVEFREHGLLLHTAFWPWQKMTRIGWSPAQWNHLVCLSAGYHKEVPIDPASRAEVNQLLAKLRLRGFEPHG